MNEETEQNKMLITKILISGNSYRLNELKKILNLFKELKLFDKMRIHIQTPGGIVNYSAVPYDIEIEDTKGKVTFNMIEPESEGFQDPFEDTKESFNIKHIISIELIKRITT